MVFMGCGLTYIFTLEGNWQICMQYSYEPNCRQISITLFLTERANSSHHGERLAVLLPLGRAVALQKWLAPPI